MRKLILLIIMLIFAGQGYSQITDDSLKNYNNTYIIPNQQIRITMFNDFFEDMIESFVNVDSATTVRYPNQDSLFVTYYDNQEDTIVFQWKMIEGWGLTIQNTAYNEDTILIDSTKIATKYDLDTTYSSGGLQWADTSKQLATDYDLDTIGVWGTWSANLTWTGGTPTVNSSMYRYQWENEKTVKFQIGITVSNSSGSTITSLTISLPATPKDNDYFQPITALVGQADITNANIVSWYIDCNNNTGSNRIIKSQNLSIPDGQVYVFYLTGFYEVD